jgi:hypothetical protein
MEQNQAASTRTVARCGAYEDRPQVCRDYPTAYHYIPPECTYSFPSGASEPREGDCACGVGACCAVPREGGEPGGTPLPEAAGGEPCKHLMWAEEPLEKIASDSSLADGSEIGRRQLLRVLGHGE